MARPPFADGAAHLSRTDSFTARATTVRGALGVVATVVDVSAESWPSPRAFSARTLKKYRLPFVSPVTVNPLPVLLARMRDAFTGVADSLPADVPMYTLNPVMRFTGRAGAAAAGCTASAPAGAAKVTWAPPLPRFAAAAFCTGAATATCAVTSTGDDVEPAALPLPL